MQGDNMGKAKRPTVKVRNAEANDTAKIVEASAPNGASCLIGLHPTADGQALYVSPYRADREVYLFVRASHTAECAVYNRLDASRRCDCGACFTFDAPSGEWRPTHKVPATTEVQP